MLAIYLSEMWPCIFGRYTNIIAVQIHLQCVSIKPSSQIKVTFSFQFQQVDPTRCLQKSPLFRFLQLWNSLQLLGLASPVHILKKVIPWPSKNDFYHDGAFLDITKSFWAFEVSPIKIWRPSFWWGSLAKRLQAFAKPQTLQNAPAVN